MAAPFPLGDISWGSLSGAPSFLHGRECGHFEMERDGRLADTAHPRWDREKPRLCVCRMGRQRVAGTPAPAGCSQLSSPHCQVAGTCCGPLKRGGVGWDGLGIPRGKYTVVLRGVYMCVLSCSVVSLCNPMDYSLPGSTVHGILQARILEWVAIPFSRGGGLPDPGIKPTAPALAGRFFATEPPGKPFLLFLLDRELRH